MALQKCADILLKRKKGGVRGGTKWGKRVFRLPITIVGMPRQPENQFTRCREARTALPDKKAGQRCPVSFIAHRASRKKFSGCPNSCQHRRHNLIFIIQQREQIQIFRAD